LRKKAKLDAKVNQIIEKERVKKSPMISKNSQYQLVTSEIKNEQNVKNNRKPILPTPAISTTFHVKFTRYFKFNY